MTPFRKFARIIRRNGGSVNGTLLICRLGRVGSGWRNSEPVAAVGDPPADPDDGDGRGQGPPEWENDVGENAEHGEADPENFALHWAIVAFSFFFAD